MKKSYITLVFAAMFAFVANAQDVVLWGGAGTKDGEFNGGLNNWTTKGVKSDDPTKAAAAVWAWSATSSAPGGYTAAANTVLNSTSKANGCAVFNSDVLDSGTGATKNVGAGTCPAPHIGELVSPTIDVKNEPNLTIVFSQLFRNFRGNTYIQYSKDDGKTWSDNVIIYLNDFLPTYRYNTNYTTSVVTRVQLPGAGGTDKFKFKFVFDGDYYFWCIDDVAVVRQEDTNLRTNIGFYAIPENLNTPLNQFRETPFVNDIQNLGGKPAKDVKHYVNIKQGTNVVFADSLSYADFPIDSTIENKVFNKTFLPTAKGTYTGSYSIKSAGTDIETVNNSIPTFSFAVGDSIFAKETRRTRSVAPGFNAGEDHLWSYGNSFFVKKGKGMRATAVEFGIDNAADVKDETITAYLYEWEDTDEDTTMQVEELKIVGIKDYTVLGTEAVPTGTNPKLIKIFLENFDNAKKPLALKDNTHYVVLLESNTTGKADDVFLSASDDYEYAATSLAYGEKFLASYSDVLKVGDQFYTAGFANVVPMVRLSVSAIPTDVEDTKLAETTVKVGPNPASNYVNVAFNFETTMSEVNVRIVDAAGRTALTAQYNNILADNVTMDINTLANGTYQMYISTDKGVATKSFVVAK